MHGASGSLTRLIPRPVSSKERFCSAHVGSVHTAKRAKPSSQHPSRLIRLIWYKRLRDHRSPNRLVHTRPRTTMWIPSNNMCILPSTPQPQPLCFIQGSDQNVDPAIATYSSATCKTTPDQVRQQPIKLVAIHPVLPSTGTRSPTLDIVHQVTCYLLFIQPGL